MLFDFLIPFHLRKAIEKGQGGKSGLLVAKRRKAKYGGLVELSSQNLLRLSVFQRREFFKRWNQWDQAFDFLERLEQTVRSMEESRSYHLPPSIQFISLIDEAYPQILRELPQPPLGLFVEGRLGSGPYVSVVGSRKPTAYSLRLTRACVRNWSRAGYSIVSGGALGIDAEAHRAAIDFEAHTIVVLGGGHQHLHPRRHENLFREVVRTGGALISEYPPHFLPRSYTFPERNRIIAALGEELFLAQAHEKSGSLSTARASLDLGRDIYVLRPPAGDPNFAGSAELIEAGAYPLTSPEDLRRDTSLPRLRF